ncbi:Detected protein of unknown function [Hibiscus syriacus]|uniref:F-box domain-containing protein n=1 Tax=Hibiscus syriacus TaxID=106335 RepID=A0A6A2XHL8_HIBSY|nr:Detected protein of unknown function [Hibiscus syriacus]
MEEDAEFRCWDELLPDALGLIFKNLPLQEILTVIPRVYKSWRRAVSGPYSWQDINIEQWSQQGRPEILDRMLQMLITKSKGSLRKLCVTGLRNGQSFSFIADNFCYLLLLPTASSAKSLRTLRLPRSEISDSVVEQVAGRLSSDDEALAIATTIPKLKQLEVAYLLISTEGVLKILESCPDLELLDVWGWNVKLDESCQEIFPAEGSSGYLAWDFVAGDVAIDYDDEMWDGDWEDDQSMEDVEKRFYDSFDSENAAFDWPLSP